MGFPGLARLALGFLGAADRLKRIMPGIDCVGQREPISNGNLENPFKLLAKVAARSSPPQPAPR